MIEYDPIQIHFVMDAERETRCNFGEYHERDGIILVNLVHIDDQESLISTIEHEVLHKAIIEESGETTSHEAQHFIIPKMMS